MVYIFHHLLQSIDILCIAFPADSLAQGTPVSVIFSLIFYQFGVISGASAVH